ncbi:MAG: Hsp70 family protein [Acidobacteria bacterium]|nr:Hsp70 family protein [Acidobacteriota bacterium]
MKLGIDFGTTRTRVAAVIGGNYPLISFHSDDCDGQDWYPSLIATQGDRALFGLDALRVQYDSSWELCRSFKRFLENHDPQAKLAIGGLQLPLIEWLTGFFSALRQDLLQRSNLEAEPGGALQVMAGVPANANSNQRFLTLEAMRGAGFELLGMMNEPAAAGIEYAQRYRQSDVTKRREHVAVYDFGGGTFDVSVIRMTGPVHEIAASEGVSRLGGDDLDEILLELTLTEPAVAAGTSKWIQRSRLLNLCREAKESINPNTRRITVDLGQISLVGGEVLVPISAFYEKCEPLIARTVAATESALAAVMGKDFAELPSLACVYLVGGSCELPLIARALRERFGKRVRRSPYPSAATAIGLAIAAGHPGGYPLQERFHRHFGVWRESEAGARVVFDPIFSKGTLLPANGGQALMVTRRYEPAHNVGHFRFLECSHLGELQEPRGDIITWDHVLFPFDPELASVSDLNAVPVRNWRGVRQPVVEETYRCDAGGIIEVVISNETTGMTRCFRIRQGNSGKAASG